ncbi:MAG: MFS transporter [Flavobacteriaceae bacterium]
MKHYASSANWKSPAAFLMVMAAANAFSMAGWQALINNFAVSEASFTGADIGLLQSVREIPGFLAFTAIFLILFMREQTLAIVALLFLGLGVAAAGFMPTLGGLLLTTLISSAGFHYYETMNQSLALQWLPKAEAPAAMGRILSVAASAQLVSYGAILIASKALNLSYQTMFLYTGMVTIVLVALLATAFPRYKHEHVQHKKIILRPRYWLYYALVFMSGARRQIFIVFAAFMMVEKFHYSVAAISALFLVNCAINMVLAPVIGRLIGRWGERRAMGMEYAGLIVIFTAYAVVDNPWVAGLLYVLDHVFFAMQIAVKTYFQKIGDARDMAGTAAVAFTINHIAAVFIPVLFGLMWLVSPAYVFLAGAAMATVSLVLSRLVPHLPAAGNETILVKPVPQAAE